MRLIASALASVAAPAVALALEIPASKPEEAVRTMHKIAYCLAISDPVALAEMLAAVPGSNTETARVLRLRKEGGRCLSGVMPSGEPGDFAAISFHPAIVRGPFAEALLIRWRMMPGARRKALTRPFDLLEAAASSQHSASTRTSLVLLNFADCVYRSAPSDVMPLFTTKPASPQEKEAIDRLSSHLAPCLSAGAEFKINHYLLRGALAEAAYRHALIAASAAQTTRRER